MQTRNDKNGKRVAIVGRLDEPGGVQSVILSLIRGLNAKGILPDLIWDASPNPALLKSRQAAVGFQPVRFRVPSKVLDHAPVTVRFIMRTANLVSDQQLPCRYDFFYIFYNGFLVKSSTPHVRYLSGPPLLPQLDMVSPGLRGIPYRFLRGIYRKWLRRRAPIYEYHRDSPYIINSEFTARLFEEAHGVKLPVIHPPLDLTGRSFTPGDLPQRDTITYFSRYANHKRPEMVIELADRYPDYRFVIMGGLRKQQQGYYEELRQMASSRALANLTFYTNPTDTKVREELARTRFYVFPGLNEHFGITTAEAIASGAIPFVHDSGGQREIVPDARLRFTDSTFIEKFESLIKLPETELQQIQLHLRDHVLHFSEEEFTEKMIALIGSPQKVSD